MFMLTASIAASIAGLAAGECATAGENSELCLNYLAGNIKYNGCAAGVGGVEDPACTTNGGWVKCNMNTCPKATGFKTRGDKGDWGDWQVCPEGSAAVGFRTKHEKDQGNGDDSGTNAIEMRCNDPGGSVLKSNLEGKWGDWELEFHSCTAGYSGVKVYYDSAEVGDKAATSCVEMHCGDGEWHAPADGDFCKRAWDGDGADVGTCGPDWAACGFRLQVEPDQGGYKDDTALNAVEFKCCKGAKRFQWRLSPSVHCSTAQL